MKKMTLILVNGNKATYNTSEIEDLAGTYRIIKSYLFDNNDKYFGVTTDDGKHEIVVNTSNLIAIDVEY